MNLTEASEKSEAVYKRVLRETLSAIIAEVVASKKHRICWSDWYGSQGDGPVVTIPSAVPTSRIKLVLCLANRQNGYEAQLRLTERDFELREWGEIMFFSWDDLDNPMKCGEKLRDEVFMCMVDFINELHGLNDL